MSAERAVFDYAGAGDIIIGSISNRLPVIKLSFADELCNIKTKRCFDC